MWDASREVLLVQLRTHSLHTFYYYRMPCVGSGGECSSHPSPLSRTAYGCGVMGTSRSKDVKNVLRDFVSRGYRVKQGKRSGHYKITSPDGLTVTCSGTPRNAHHLQQMIEHDFARMRRLQGGNG